VPETIGAVQQVDLEIHKGAALVFDAEWWEEDGTPVPIAALNVRLVLAAQVFDIDALGYATFQGNVIHIALPSHWTETLPATSGKWRLGATDAVSLEERPLARGSVKVRQ